MSADTQRFGPPSVAQREGEAKTTEGVKMSASPTRNKKHPDHKIVSFDLYQRFCSKNID